MIFKGSNNTILRLTWEKIRGYSKPGVIGLELSRQLSNDPIMRTIGCLEISVWEIECVVCLHLPLLYKVEQNLDFFPWKSLDEPDELFYLVYVLHNTL